MNLNRRLISVVFAAGLLAAACGGTGATTAPTSQSPVGAGVSGEIFVTGSSTVLPISQAVAESFRALNPDFGFTVEGPGTGDGFAALCSGSADVADASRPIDAQEIQACSDSGISYTELLIGYDGITVMTHPDTAVDCLTTADLYALFGPESDDISTWQDAGVLAAELDSTTAFPTNLALQITAPGEESGTYDAFIELAGIDDRGVARGVFTEDADPFLRVPGPNYTASGDDNVIVQGVEAGAGSLGFVGFAYYTHAGDTVKAIDIDAGEGCVEPTLETIADGSYPLSRPLFIYPSNASADENAAVQSWVDYYLSDAGIEHVANADYVPLPADRLQATRDAWANR